MTIAASGSALSAEGLSKRYGDRLALREVSLEAGRGELVAVIGPNGAGKTTLLQILAGALAPTQGHVSLPPEAVGWVPQQPALYKKLSVAENLKLFARLERASAGQGRHGWRPWRSRGRPDEGPGNTFDVREAVGRMLEQTGLGERAGDEVGRLSGGNQQRLNIAIGLLKSPVALLLDEPSAALDPRQSERLWGFIGGLAATGTAVVYSTHDVGEAERYADRVLVLADGELLFTGTPRELEQAVDLERHGGRSSQSWGRPDGGTGTPPDFEAAFVRFLHDRGH
jgi:ABC-2 type transport system ATP-binding protein